MAPLRDELHLLELVRAIHEQIRSEVVAGCEGAAADEMSTVTGREGGDTIYVVDRLAERVLIQRFASLADEWPCLLVAEGLGATGRLVLPVGTDEEDIEIAVIVDPIDGTRGLMFQKRPAWILTGVAPYRPGAVTTLADIRLAVQTEIPLLKQHLADAAWAIAGQGAAGERFDRLSGKRSSILLRPSTAKTITHGFGGLAKFFSGTRADLAAIDDAVVSRLLGTESATGEALVFDDQYISTGGQLFELMSGHDRWVADVRPLLISSVSNQSDSPPLCAHPYDLASELVAREAGVVVTDPIGDPLNAPFDVTTNVAWLGFANRHLAGTVGAALSQELRARGLL